MVSLHVHWFTGLHISLHVAIDEEDDLFALEFLSGYGHPLQITQVLHF